MYVCTYLSIYLSIYPHLLEYLHTCLASMATSGFYFGARYGLVLFAAADALHASVALRAASGKQLWRGTFNRSACRAPERRRLHAAAAAGELPEASIGHPAVATAV